MLWIQMLWGQYEQGIAKTTYMDAQPPISYSIMKDKRWSSRAVHTFKRAQDLKPTSRHSSCCSLLVQPQPWWPQRQRAQQRAEDTWHITEVHLTSLRAETAESGQSHYIQKCWWCLDWSSNVCHGDFWGYQWLNQAAHLRFMAFKMLPGSHEKGAPELLEPR